MVDSSNLTANANSRFSDMSDPLKLVTPDNAAALILAAINVLGRKRAPTLAALWLGLTHDDFLAMSRVVSALSANRTAFG